VSPAPDGRAARHGRLVALVPIPVLLLVWELIGRLEVFNVTLFPPPSRVLVALGTMLGDELPADLGASLSRAGLGYAVGATLGIGVGLLTGRYLLWRRLLNQVFQLLRPIPPISLVPVSILWFGLGEPSKYFLISWGVFFPVWITTFLGVSRVEHTYVWAAASLGAGERALIREVVLPAALPSIIAGLRTALAIAFYCLVAAEIAGAFSGVAFRLDVSHTNLQVDRMFAGLIVLGIVSAAADRLFVVLTARLFPWMSLA
jgi:NitT/TauT family transport system permease protein